MQGAPCASASSPGAFSKAFCTRCPMAVMMAERSEYALPPRCAISREIRPATSFGHLHGTFLRSSYQAGQLKPESLLEILS